MNDNHAATYLQIDLQNLFFEARNQGQKIDFDKVWHFFNDRETEILTAASVYLVRGDDFDGSKFEAKLRTLGYDIKAKNVTKHIKKNKTSYRNSNHDVTITIDCMDKIDTFNKWILMSGDGDFADLCKYVKRRGKKVEVWSFKECYNTSLEMYADKVHFIDEKFFYKKPKVTVFGPNWSPGKGRPK